MPLLGRAPARHESPLSPVKSPFHGASTRLAHPCVTPPQEISRHSSRTISTTSFLYYCIYDNITISQGERCVLRDGLSRPQQHILTSLSRPDTVHTLPLNTILHPCRVDRCGHATTILLVKLFHHRAHRAHRGAAHGESNCSTRRCSQKKLNIC